ncbi:hypothetical protein A7979_09220 [Rothia nasimurium]|uniref:Uncharacterized protein n=1 Tax=Rothia nasimurium TaxID=85336 RepID=A0A1Y1RSJ7_9MICC|nr:hypothetical protein A7979_09220 [Rothia nasimurium]
MVVESSELPAMQTTGMGGQKIDTFLMLPLMPASKGEDIHTTFRFRNPSGSTQDVEQMEKLWLLLAIEQPSQKFAEKPWAAFLHRYIGDEK